MRTTILALAVGFLVAAPARAGSPAEKEVLAAMDVWKDAMIKKDQAAFEKVLHPDLTYGHSSGLVESKAEAIKHVVEQPATYTGINFKDTKVNVQGKAATVIGKVDYLERANGKDNVVNLMVLTTWVKGAKGWQMLARQAAKLPAAAPSAAPPAPPAKTTH